MRLKDKNLISLKEIEGAIVSHDGFLKRAEEVRKEALEYVDDVSKLAEYIGAEAVHLGIGEDWAIKKQVFPGVEVNFVYNHPDTEFPGNLRVLFSGDRVRDVPGEDLSELAIASINHMLRYVRGIKPGDELPEICHRV